MSECGREREWVWERMSVVERVSVGESECGRERVSECGRESVGERE